MAGILYLGCPVWNHRSWVGSLYTGDANPEQFLGQYAQVFNAVEGNTTFYGVPAAATVARWCEQAPAHFRFCFKFPRTISHDKRLLGAGEDTRTFLDRLAPLGERLGPLFLQLSPQFDHRGLDALSAYLSNLPGDYHYAVEVRHPDWFDGGVHEHRLHDVLRRHRVERVVADSRALFSRPPDDAETRAAWGKKPRVPAHVVALGTRPFVRFIGHREAAVNAPYLERWVDKVAKWLGEGRSPYVFIHSPDNRGTPEACAYFHALLRQRGVDLPLLAAFPGAQPVAAAETPQLGLFG